MKVEFSRLISKILISNSMNIHPVSGELFLAYGQTDRRTGRYEEANSRFSQFSKALKNEKVLCSDHVHLRNLSSFRPYVRPSGHHLLFCLWLSING